MPSEPVSLVLWRKSTDHHPDAETPSETDACIPPTTLENFGDPTMISAKILTTPAETPVPVELR